MNFAENLRALREKQGITQEQLAEKMEVSRQTVSKWESGSSFPEMEKEYEDTYGISGAIPGLFIETSDIGMCAFRLKGFIEMNKIAVFTRDEYSRIHTGSIDIESVIDTAKKKILPEMKYFPERLADLMNIDITDDSMTYDERKAFILIKMKESKVLNDEVSFNFWNSNLKQLEGKKQETPVNTQVSQNITTPITPQEEQSMQNKNQSSQPTIENSETLYDKMISALRKSRTDNLTQDEKKQIVGEIYYYEGFLIESLKDEKDIWDVLTKAMQDFSNSQFEQSVLSSLISELQEKLKIVSPKKGEELKVDDGSILSNINILKQEMNILSAEYAEIRSDGKVDDRELDYLITRMQELYRTAMSLKGNNLSPKEYQIVNEIIASISNEQRKMTIFRSDIEQSIQGFSR